VVCSCVWWWCCLCLGLEVLFCEVVVFSRWCLGGGSGGVAWG